MSLGVWIVIGYVAMLVTTAVAARWSIAYVTPDVLVVVTTFVALRRNAIQAGLLALLLGYLMGIQQPSPLGLSALALVVCTLSVYVASGQLSTTGWLAFGPLCGVAAMGHAALTWAILKLDGADAAFASLATALLFPAGIVTMLAAWLAYVPMLHLERRVAPTTPQGLQWR